MIKYPQAENYKWSLAMMDDEPLSQEQVWEHIEAAAALLAGRPLEEWPAGIRFFLDEMKEHAGNVKTWEWILKAAVMECLK